MFGTEACVVGCINKSVGVCFSSCVWFDGTCLVSGSIREGECSMVEILEVQVFYLCILSDYQSQFI